MIKNRYPLPLISSGFELLAGTKVFTELDLHNAYHLVRILIFSPDEESHVFHVHQILSRSLEN